MQIAAINTFGEYVNSALDISSNIMEHLFSCFSILYAGSETNFYDNGWFRDIACDFHQHQNHFCEPSTNNEHFEKSSKFSIDHHGQRIYVNLQSE